MAITFSKSMRSLNADRGVRALWSVLLAAIILGAWVFWLLSAHVGLYETSRSARLEVERAAHPVEAQCAGRVADNRMNVGQVVSVGDVLLLLDATALELELAEVRSVIAGTEGQLAAIRQQLVAQERAVAQDRESSARSVEEARARHAEAQAAELYATEQARHVAELAAKGNAPDIENRLAHAEAAQRTAAAEAARISVNRLQSELQTRELERTTEQAALQREEQQLRGALASSLAMITRLEHQIDVRRIRAPIAGVVAEAAPIVVGGYIKEGDRVGAILPPGGMKVVAQFAPSAALGRIAPGQPARVRLDGFPWSRYGSLTARVAQVSGEVREGLVHVELRLDAQASSAIPVQHGLPGVVEIEVNRLSPAALILQTAGMRASSPSGAADPPAGKLLNASGAGL